MRQKAPADTTKTAERVFGWRDSEAENIQRRALETLEYQNDLS